MAYTAGKQDGQQKFGFTDGTIEGLIVESYTESKTSNRVDIDDGNGKPIGSAVVPGRVEVTATVQYGASGSSALKVGESITYDGNTIGITGVEFIEAQSDYVRMSITGYVLTNGSLQNFTPTADVS